MMADSGRPLSRLLNITAINHYRAPLNTSVKPFHIVDGWEYVELLTSGGVWFEVEGEERRFMAGTIFWHQAGDLTIHRSLPDLPYQCMCFRFAVEGGAARPVPRVSIWDEAAEAVDFCWEAFQLFMSGQMDNHLLAGMIYGRLLWACRRRVVRTELGKASGGLPAALTQSMTFVEKHKDEDFRVERLAREAGISVPHLHALFREHVGVTPHQYVLERRLLQARDLLVNSFSQVKAVGRECGFANVETFCRAFRKRFGMTPTELRQERGSASAIGREPQTFKHA